MLGCFLISCVLLDIQFFQHQSHGLILISKNSCYLTCPSSNCLICMNLPSSIFNHEILLFSNTAFFLFFLFTFLHILEKGWAFIFYFFLFYVNQNNNSVKLYELSLFEHHFFFKFLMNNRISNLFHYIILLQKRTRFMEMPAEIIA